MATASADSPRFWFAEQEARGVPAARHAQALQWKSLQEEVATVPLRDWVGRRLTRRDNDTENMGPPVNPAGPPGPWTCALGWVVGPVLPPRPPP